MMSRTESSKRNKRPEAVSAVGVVSSTEAQNNFGAVVARALREGIVYITKYGAETAVVLSMDRFRTLVPSQQPDLDALTGEFDALLAQMQTRNARAATDALFSMTPDELAETAVQTAEQKTA
jgi:prevent-host-death family protein